RARYYDPSLGRYLTPDPVSGQLTNPNSLHPYLYAYNNPLKFRDPFGTFAPSDIADTVEGAVGYVGGKVGYGIGYGVSYGMTAPFRAYNWATGNTKGNERIDSAIETFSSGVTGLAGDKAAKFTTSLVTDRLRFGASAGELQGGTWDNGKSATGWQLGLTA